MGSRHSRRERPFTLRIWVQERVDGVFRGFRAFRLKLNQGFLAADFHRCHGHGKYTRDRVVLVVLVCDILLNKMPESRMAWMASRS